MRSLLGIVFSTLLLLANQRTFAESVNERDFKLARAERDKAATAALDPINRRYKETLEKLFKKATQSAELDLARQLQAELQAFGGATAAKTAGAGQPASPSTAGAIDKADLKKLVENSEWVVSAKVKPDFSKDDDGRLVFHKDGSVAASGKFANIKFFTIEAPDVVKLYHGNSNPKKNRNADCFVLHVNMVEKTALKDESLSKLNGNIALKFDGPAKSAK